MVTAQSIRAIRDHYVANGYTDASVLDGLLQPQDIGKDYTAGNNNYLWFLALGQWFRPQRILEFGTRFGYTLKCFVDGAAWPVAAYDMHCVDDERDGFPVLDTCRDYFLKTYPGIRINFVRAATETLQQPPCTLADLCLVDAYHTEDGCIHECQLGWTALRSGGVLVVDDLDCDPVRRGLQKFCNTIARDFEELPALRRTAFLIKD